MTFSNDPGLRVLVEMMTRMRPAGSKTERRFIREYIRPLGVESDGAGNLIKRIGSAPVLWSCHTDTVHKVGGSQLVEISKGTAHLSPRSKSNCLGADCTTGVWIMREMILAGVPGLYVFHRGEEIGGIGSSYIVRRTPELVRGITAAIAFDRAGYNSVITHQGSRCCSNAFAYSLVDALDAQGLTYAPDDTGTFTDTANYVDLIGECTNISVGYHGQHRASETQDLNYALRLRDALCSLDTSTLRCERKPGELDPDDYSNSVFSNWQDTSEREKQRDMVTLICDHPDVVADLLAEFGYDATALADEVWARLG